MLPKEEFRESLLNYYKIRGWDSNGIPEKKKLKELGIEKYTDKIEYYNETIKKG